MNKKKYYEYGFFEEATLEDVIEELKDHDVNKVSFLSDDTWLNLALKKSPDKNIPYVLIQEYKADVNKRYKKGLFPAQIAAAFHDVDMMKMLHSHGANLDVVDKDGNTLLHLAVKQGDLELIAFLIENTSHINTKNKKGETPILMYRREYCSDIIRLMISKGADKDAVDNKGNTLLHNVMFHGGSGIIRMLITEFDMDIMAKNKNGKTPFSFISFREKGHINPNKQVCRIMQRAKEGTLEKIIIQNRYSPEP